jgi:glyoxylase I family protein
MIRADPRGAESVPWRLEAGGGESGRLSVRSTGVHHVDLVVSSITRSLPFYTDLLGPLGYTRVGEVEGERGETIWYLSGPGTSVGLRESQSDQPHDRYAIGLHHIAFEAESRAQVDEVADWVRTQSVEIESEPQEYTYQPGYYAVFFYDPDGIKLEIVHVPGLVAA